MEIKLVNWVISLQSGMIFLKKKDKSMKVTHNLADQVPATGDSLLAVSCIIVSTIFVAFSVRVHTLPRARQRGKVKRSQM